MRIGSCTQAFEWYQFECPSLTSNPDFKVMAIQHQKTQKWYNIELYQPWQTNSKSYMIYRMVQFSMTLTDPYLRFQSHAILWLWISQKRYEIQTYFQWNTNRDLHTPYSAVSFRMTLSDLEWFSKIINDTKHRAVSLWQLGFFLVWPMQMSNVQRLNVRMSSYNGIVNIPLNVWILIF